MNLYGLLVADLPGSLFKKKHVPIVSE